MKITETEKALWQMLDDISTAGDMFKPDMNSSFVQYVLNKCEERGKYLMSDGYELYLPEDFPKQDVSKQEALLNVPKDAPDGN